jgi:hypothetical protein
MGTSLIGRLYMGQGGDMWEISVHAFQFCYKSKISLNNKI